jgi:hypothetical protein
MSVLLPTARGVWRCPPPGCRVTPALAPRSLPL